jgi:hypothetical protein
LTFSFLSSKKKGEKTITLFICVIFITATGEPITRLCATVLEAGLEQRDMAETTAAEALDFRSVRGASEFLRWDKEDHNNRDRFGGGEWDEPEDEYLNNGLMEEDDEDDDDDDDEGDDVSWNENDFNQLFINNVEQGEEVLPFGGSEDSVPGIMMTSE